MNLNGVIMENIAKVDITEPAAMHMLLVRVEEIYQENEEYMELLLERLVDMIITWDQPWYQMTYSLTRPVKEEVEDTDRNSETKCTDSPGPDKEDEDVNSKSDARNTDSKKEDANNKNETFRTGAFSKEERKVVRKNWKTFRKDFQLPDKPICLIRWRNKDAKHPKIPQERVRHFIISYLAQGLERNLYQVYRQFVTEYGSPVKGPYTAQEEKIMEICLYHYPKSAVIYLTALLRREPRTIYNRLQYIRNRKPVLKDKIKSKLQMATKFLQKLMKHSGYSLKELKNRTFDVTVWHKLQEDMCQPYYKLQKFWYRRLHVLLFVKYDVELARLGKKLIKMLQSSEMYEMWTDIRWNVIAKTFPDGFTAEFLKGVAYRLIRKYQVLGNKWLREPLNDVVKRTLYQLKTVPRDLRHLKTLTLNYDGMLEPIKYDLRMNYRSIN